MRVHKLKIRQLTDGATTLRGSRCGRLRSKDANGGSVTDIEGDVTCVFCLRLIANDAKRAKKSPRRKQLTTLLYLIARDPGHPATSFPPRIRGFFRTAEKLGLAEWKDGGWYLTDIGREAQRTPST